MNTHRNLAIYKEDGTPWSYNEYERVVNFCNGVEHVNTSLDIEFSTHKYIFDDGRSTLDWSSQEDNYNFDNCKKISYEELFLRLY